MLRAPMSIWSGVSADEWSAGMRLSFHVPGHTGLECSIWRQVVRMWIGLADVRFSLHDDAVCLSTAEGHHSRPLRSLPRYETQGC